MASTTTTTNTITVTVAEPNDVPTVANTTEVFIKYPPFPDPPPGVAIIPFTQFTPSGIRINVEGATDEQPSHGVELDGQGRPTVMLRVRHSTTNSERRRKKKQPQTIVQPNGVMRNMHWFETWEAGDDLRRSVFDP